MKSAIRYLFPLAVVIACLVAHFSTKDDRQYTSRIDARIFEKQCEETGKNRGVVKYAFVIGKDAYEGRFYEHSNCRARAIGGLITVKYVFETPGINMPAKEDGVTPLGAVLWAAFAYIGMILAGHLMWPTSRQKRKGRKGKRRS